MKWINYIPLFRLVIPFCLGIISCFYFPYPIQASQLTLLTASLALLVFLLTHYRKLHVSYNLRWVFGILSILIFFVIGYLYANARFEKFEPDHYLQTKTGPFPIQSYEATLVTEPEIKPNSIKVVLEINKYRSHNTWTECSGKVLVYFKKETQSELKYGDQILFSKMPMEISPPTNFDEFDYKRYLSHHYIYERIYLSSTQFKVIGFRPPYYLKNKAINWRNWLVHRYLEFGINGEELAIISALTLGKKESLTSELKSAYATAGAMHVLAVSGLHVGIVYLVLRFLFGWMDRFKYGKTIKAILLIISVWFYAIITGLSPSVIRAATMFSFMIFALSFKRKSNIYNTLALSGIAILLYEPFMLLEVGFQLSYLAVIGIIYLHSHLYKLLYFQTWILDKAWEITCVSLSAQLVTAPLGILYFHQFPNYFLFSNLLVIPAAFFIIFLAIGFQALAFIPILGKVISWALLNTVWILNYLVRQLEVLPYALISGLDISLFETWLMYLLVLALTIWLTLFKNRFLIYSLGIILLLVTSQTLEKYTQMNQREITFFSTGKDPLIQLNLGIQQHLFGDVELLSNKDRMQFYVQHHDWKRGVNMDGNKLNNQQKKYRNWLWFGKTKILLLTKENSLLPYIGNNLNHDILFIDTYKLPKQEKLVSLVKDKIVIIGSNASRKVKQCTQQICDSLDTPYYSIKENGAIKITLSKNLEPMVITHQKPR